MNTINIMINLLTPIWQAEADDSDILQCFVHVLSITKRALEFETLFSSNSIPKLVSYSGGVWVLYILNCKV